MRVSLYAAPPSRYLHNLPAQKGVHILWKSIVVAIPSDDTLNEVRVGPIFHSDSILFYFILILYSLISLAPS